MQGFHFSCLFHNFESTMGAQCGDGTERNGSHRLDHEREMAEACLGAPMTVHDSRSHSNN